MKPSITAQLDATLIKPGAKLLKSPRHWNAGMFEFEGRLWMAYRYHRNLPDSRCGIGMVEINPKTRQPKSASQALKLPDGQPFAHHEDARLFTYKGEPYISYSEMSGYQPGVDYSCVVKYSRLKYAGGKWKAIETWQPEYGQNDGTSKEKNWVFFESDGSLYCIYADQPNHIVLQIEGNQVVKEYVSAAPHWSWGQVRGGAAPIKIGDDFLHVFHSSLPTEIRPHYVRYYAGAYTFSAKPPFAPISITRRPLMVGSERDGHRVDPRYVAGWKPYVVFPCGAVKTKDGLLVSLGVNDWACAIAKLPEHLDMVDAFGRNRTDRFFVTPNGSVPIRLMGISSGPHTGAVQFLSWRMGTPGPACTPGRGYMKVNDERVAEELLEFPYVKEISANEYMAGVK